MYQAIAGDLPRAATTVLEVPMEAGESLGTGVGVAASASGAGNGRAGAGSRMQARQNAE